MDLAECLSEHDAEGSETGRLGFGSVRGLQQRALFHLTRIVYHRQGPGVRGSGLN